jgi:glycosyltransferase involved in cell wall biosynthesis
MANQTRQLARLLTDAGLAVETVQVNPPYRPAWIGRVRGARAALRLVFHLLRLWRAAGRADLMHVMANSGWAWHLFAAPAVWIAWLRGVPAVINYRGGEAEAFFARSIALVRPTLARAAAVVVPSGFLASVFSRYGVATVIVPNVVDLERFRPAPHAGEGGPHLIVTRNLEDLYDIPTALRALALVRQSYPDARLTVAGSGPRRLELEALAAELGIAGAVRFTGRLDNECMAALYREADLLLNPSLADNMPISLLEAMASAVPIVSTRVGGVPFLVKDGEEALLVPPGDATAMAAAAVRLLGDPRLADALRRAGCEKVKQFTWDRVRPRLFHVYARVLGRRDFEAVSP